MSYKIEIIINYIVGISIYWIMELCFRCY